MGDQTPRSGQYLPRKYVVGDEITAGIFVSHIQNLVNIEAIFRHVEDEAITMTFGDVSGNMNQTFLFEMNMLRHKSSAVELSAEVELAHSPGLYELLCVSFYTASGKPITVERKDITPVGDVATDYDTTLDGFEIIPEPDWVSSFRIMTVTEYEGFLRDQYPEEPQ